MAKDVADVLGNALGRAAREAVKNISFDGGGKSKSGLPDRLTDAVTNKLGDLSGSKGLATGVGIATLAPLAAKGAGKLVRGIGGGGGDGDSPVKKAGAKVGEKVAEKAGGGKSGAPGVGKGRRMPVQQDIDIGMPIAQVYEQWTNWEEWPTFMHRLQNVSQEDDKHVTFKTKIWGISKEFRAEIVEQDENARIKWQVTDGVTHTGVVTFHELGPRLTRVELNLDVQPGSMIEKAARGMRHVKRAVRADMARFKAYVLMQEEETPDEDSGDQEQSGESRQQSSGSRSASRGSSGGGSSSRSRGSSSSGGSRSRSSSGGSRSRSSSSGASKRSTSSRSRSSSSGGSGGSSKKSSSGARKGSTSGGRKQSSNGRSSASRTRASSSNGPSGNGRSSSSSKRRSSSTRASSNGNSRSTSARKRTGSRS